MGQILDYPNKREIIKQGLKNGLIIDTSLLMVYLIGFSDLEYLSKFSRTQNYRRDHFEWLEDLFKAIPKEKQLTTPNILTEVSDMTTRVAKIPREFPTVFGEFVVAAKEVYVESREVLNEPFSRLGIADCVSGRVAKIHDCPFVTTDEALVAELLEIKVKAFSIFWDFPK